MVVAGEALPQTDMPQTQMGGAQADRQQSGSGSCLCGQLAHGWPAQTRR